jgi:hypothetical protein
MTNGFPGREGPRGWRPTAPRVVMGVESAPPTVTRVGLMVAAKVARWFRHGMGQAMSPTKVGEGRGGEQVDKSWSPCSQTTMEAKVGWSVGTPMTNRFPGKLQRLGTTATRVVFGVKTSLHPP